MPKVIQPRRHDKTLSVQQFWDIRDMNKAPVVARPAQAHREQEVSLRHRFKKPSEQAKIFNPLSYFLTSSRNDSPSAMEEEPDTFLN